MRRRNDDGSAMTPLPVIGVWYQSLTGDHFEIVATDENEATIEIQYFDGTVEEIEASNWVDFVDEEIEPPEDWSGSMDMAREDFGPEFEDFLYEDWQNPLDMMDRL